MGTPNREPQEYGRNTIEYEDSGRYYSHYIPPIFVGFPVWGSQSSPFRLGWGIGFRASSSSSQKPLWRTSKHAPGGDVALG